MNRQVNIEKGKQGFQPTTKGKTAPTAKEYNIPKPAQTKENNSNDIQKSFNNMMLTKEKRKYIDDADKAIRHFRPTKKDEETIRTLLKEIRANKFYEINEGSYVGVENDKGKVVAYIKKGLVRVRPSANFVPENSFPAPENIEPGGWDVRLSNYSEKSAGEKDGTKQQTYEFTCSRCFLVRNINQLSGEVNGMSVCNECV